MNIHWKKYLFLLLGGFFQFVSSVYERDIKIALQSQLLPEVSSYEMIQETSFALYSMNEV